MPNSPGRGTRAGLAGVLGAGWLLLGIAAWIYARMKHYPARAAVPIAAAFLIEFPFYLSPGAPVLRDWLANLGRVRGAAFLAATAVLPWMVYSFATGEARLDALAMLLGVAAVVSFWYILLPVKPLTDALFLAVLAAIYLSKIFDRLYLSPIPKLQLSVLGHLMLIRLGAMAILALRGNVKAEYRFLPDRNEWATGIRYFALMLPVIGAAYWALGQFRPHVYPHGVWVAALLAIAVFPGVLWVLALSEEFFFRGLLQPWLEQWTGKPYAALVLQAIVFGSAHLGFARRFPNWQWVILAGILGVFCGLAWRNARSVQAPMVTHALLVTVWQAFLR